jgi:hypothetical protein
LPASPGLLSHRHSTPNPAAVAHSQNAARTHVPTDSDNWD